MMNERVGDILRHPAVIPASVGVVAFGVGFAGGYFLAKRQQPIMVEDDPQLQLDFESGFDEIRAKREQVQEEKKSFHPPIPAERVISERKITEDESETLREYVESLNDEEWEEPKVPADVRPDPSKISVDEGIVGRVERLIKDGGTPTVDDYITPIGFARDDDDDWDYVEELKARVANRPYIIHKDEFFGEEMNFSQNTLTYYEGDDILTDEEDSPIYDARTFIGDNKNWGHGSSDPNVVYIRNEKLGTEYEVIRHEGLYSVEVLGLQIEENERVRDLKHSRSPHKFKME